MERRIRRLGISLVLLFAVLFGQLAYVQVFAADDIKNHPANFSRQLIAE
jgi:cell division protein FtsI/penicillin-binding protein 2